MKKNKKFSKKVKKSIKKQLTRDIEMWYYSQADERKGVRCGQKARKKSRLKIE